MTVYCNLINDINISKQPKRPYVGIYRNGDIQSLVLVSNTTHENRVTIITGNAGSGPGDRWPDAGEEVMKFIKPLKSGNVATVWND